MTGKGGYAAPIPMYLEDKTLLVVYHGTGISCLNSEDGKPLWTAEWETE